METEHGTELCAEAVYTVDDDSRWLRHVSDVISATVQKVVVEADLKVALGLRLTKGHRTWRR